MSRVLSVPAAITTWAPWWCLLPIVAVAAVYAPLVPALVNEWWQFPNLSHGFAVPFIAAYLAWTRRRQIMTLVPTPSVWGLPLLVGGLLALLLGELGDESFIARMSLLPTLFGLTLFLGGARFFAQLWPAMSYLVFMIPLPWVTVKLLTDRSRIFDATVSTEIVRWLGVPILQNGVILHLPDIRLEVADECSSIPAIAALAALAVAYATMGRRSRISRGIIIAAAVPLALMSNIIRLVTVIAGVYYIGPVTLQSAYHMFNGTVNFLLTAMMLFALDALLARWDGRRTS